MAYTCGLRPLKCTPLVKISSTGLALPLLFCLAAPAVAVDNQPPQPAAAASSSAAPAELPHIAANLKALGIEAPMQVRAGDAASVPFSIRRDRTVVKAHLKLVYTASPALLPDVSHIKISINDEPVATISLPKEQAGISQTHEVELDPRYFTDNNRLTFELVGASAQGCAGTWLSVSNLSTLDISLTPLTLRNDLALMPAPFFDRLDNSRLTLPFIFPAEPTFEMVQAAGTTASWFGAMASWRGAQFPVLFDKLPEGNAIVFVRNHDQLSVLPLPQVQAPTLRLMSHPRLNWAKLLVVQGRDDTDLMTAAAAMALGQVTLTGEIAVVNAVDLGPRRRPYDAPNWLQTDKPVPFRQLVENTEALQAPGNVPRPIRVNLRVPPDLFAWPGKGAPMDLRYRFTPPAGAYNPMLSVSLNRRFVQGFSLLPGGTTAEKSRLLLPLASQESQGRQDDLLLPGFRLGSDSELQFRFSYDTHRQDECKSAEASNVFAAIDEDSTIDLRGLAHYATLPDLALFARAGFPFTRYADLSETAFVLPDHPAPSDMQMALAVFGLMGKVTGMPALRHHVVPISAVDQFKDNDLVILDSSTQGKMLSSWPAQAKLLLGNGQRDLLRPFGAALRNPAADEDAAAPASGHVSVNAEGYIAAISGFASPFAKGRSAVALSASGPEAAQQLVSVLLDPAQASQVQGELTTIRGDNIESFRPVETYHVGHLPVWLQARYVLARHPLLLALLGIAVAIAGALWLAGLRRRSERS